MYRELYRPELGPAELAQAVVAMTPAEEVIGYTVADPSLFRRNEQTGMANADVMAQHGVPCVPGHNDRIAGWRMLHEYLKVYDEGGGGGMKPTARLRVFTNCLNTIRTVPAVVHDDLKPEDVNTKGEDHAADMMRYAVMSRPGLPQEPRPVDTSRSREARWEKEFGRFQKRRDADRRPSTGW